MSTYNLPETTGIEYRHWPTGWPSVSSGVGIYKILLSYHSIFRVEQLGHVAGDSCLYIAVDVFFSLDMFCLETSKGAK